LGYNGHPVDGWSLQGEFEFIYLVVLIIKIINTSAQASFRKVLAYIFHSRLYNRYSISTLGHCDLNNCGLGPS